MGFVFQAVDDALERLVALKVMRPEIAADPSSKKRFLREGRTAASVRSDHVVTIYQVGEANGVPYLAMEYLEGLNLDEWLTNWQTIKQRPVQASAIVRVAKDLLKGLVAAHEKGLIHRDIKPANLWVEVGTGRIKLLDFGLAKPLIGGVELTVRGDAPGTPAYMAPEQALERPLDPRTDLFSVGVVLYRMMAGKSPFQRDSQLATQVALVEHNPPPAASFGVIPDEMAKLIDRLLAKSPAGRPASAKVALTVVLEVEQQLRRAPDEREGAQTDRAQQEGDRTRQVEEAERVRIDTEVARRATDLKLETTIGNSISKLGSPMSGQSGKVTGSHHTNSSLKRATDNLGKGPSRKAATPEVKKKKEVDIFEADLTIPPMTDHSGSKGVAPAVGESECDIYEADFEIPPMTNKSGSEECTPEGEGNISEADFEIPPMTDDSGYEEIAFDE
jgi:serine/threonine protein kinase